MNWIKGQGKIEVDNGVRIVTNVDICKYYSWHINKAFWNTIKSQIPKHRGHVTILNPKIHKITDFSSALKYHNKPVDFMYSPEDIYISKVNFWFPAKSNIEQEIKDLFEVVDAPNYWGLHLTIANTKFEKLI